MNTDYWVVLEIKHDNKIIHKLLSGTKGGYLYGDSWSLNSGIKNIEEKEHVYIVRGFSGSSYICPKFREHLNVMTSAILSQMQEALPTVAVVPMTSVLEQYRKKEDES